MTVDYGPHKDQGRTAGDGKSMLGLLFNATSIESIWLKLGIELLLYRIAEERNYTQV